ncbi:MAG: NAD(+)/NADH kinase [Nitrospinota bacterium]
MAKIKISRLGLAAKLKSPLAAKAIEKVSAWGKKRGVEILIERETAKLTGVKGVDRESFAGSVDALVVLGGDGTLLAAARTANSDSIPLLGVNLGSLGYMTEVAYEEIEKALENIRNGNFSIENRMMLNLTIGNDESSKSETALNDVVISHKSMARIIELSLSINGQDVTHYKTDGLIISTPTGSTAYALSAGGPILHPTLEAIVICPICPHTLTHRPLVVPNSSVIDVKILRQRDDVNASVDGQVIFDVKEGDRLVVTRSEKVTRLIRMPDRTHFDVLRSKLGWGES